MTRWLAIAGLWPLLAVMPANGQSIRTLNQSRPDPAPLSRTINLRLVEEPSFNRFDPPSTGFIADTAVAPNARIGLRMMTVSRPRLGPEWRTDGRSTRSRKPSVSFSLRF